MAWIKVKQLHHLTTCGSFGSRGSKMLFNLKVELKGVFILIESGYLIVKKYESLYREYVQRYNLIEYVYGIPRIDKEPKDFLCQYHGVDRDSLSPYNNSDLLAELRLDELNGKNDVEEHDFLVNYRDVQDVIDFLEEKKFEYEVIWVRIAGNTDNPPEDYISIGFEPSYFYGDHFSASCDCMLFPRWHGTDKEGILFKAYFEKLNRFGLFNNSIIAQEFLNYYLSFDWTEIGDYFITEIFIKVRC